MTKISELESILGEQLNPNDLFVTVSILQGEDGTKKITRRELVRSLQEETFDTINITGGSVANVDIEITKQFTPNISDVDYFILRDVSSNETVKLTYAQFETELSNSFFKAKQIFVDSNAASSGNGSYLKPFKTLEDAFSYSQDNVENFSTSITVLPGEYKTNGNLALPDNCSFTSTNGQYATTISMNTGFEGENCILVGSGCYVQGFAFNYLVIDNFDSPTGGFAVAFRPDALILRSPYIRDISQISNYRRESIAAPLNPLNSQGTISDLGEADFPNPLVGRGGGVILADRAVLNQNSIFPYILAFGATPRSPNGIGYVAKNGAGINGIGSITVFQRCAFYALNGGQITLNNSGTQFGDISMRAKGSTAVVNPYETQAVLVTATDTAATIDAATNTIIDELWDYLTLNEYNLNEDATRKDARNLIQSISFDLQAGTQTSTRNFIAGLFDYKGDHIFDITDQTLTQSYIDTYDFILVEIKSLTVDQIEIAMLDGLFDDILKATLLNPSKLNFGSLIESIGHQFNLAGAGVNKNALPLNFRRVGESRSAIGSILQEDGGRVRFSGADELNNQFFARGLKINGRTGRLEGRPFTSSVRRLARRAANSRIIT